MGGIRQHRGIAAGLAALLLAGCVSNFYETPRPFEGKHRNDPMLDSILTGASVEVRPVDGLPKAEAAALSRAISEAAHEHDIAAVTDEGAAMADRLTGTASVTTRRAVPDLPPRLYVTGRGKQRWPVPGQATVKHNPVRAPETEIRISWKLTGADGAVKDTLEIAQTISGTLPELDKRERTGIAARTAAWLRAALDREAVSTAQAEARQSKPLILVSPVDGASGDGRVSLTSALAELLAASGACDVMPATEEAQIPKGRSAYRVKGRVDIRDAGPGAQTVAIAWTLTDMAGREVGTITQQNAIPKGSLEGPWGDTAYAAAMGARDGLLALLEEKPAQANER